MSKVTSLHRSEADRIDARSEKIVQEIRTLLGALSPEEQERILRAVRPAPRAGEVLGTIVRLLPRRSEWTVQDIKRDVAAAGVKAASKEIYNALGYLARRGHVQRLGYGRYVVGGVGVHTSDDFGGEPGRNEDD